MSTHVPGFQSFFLFFLHHFVLAELATSSIRVSTCAAGGLFGQMMRKKLKNDGKQMGTHLISLGKSFPMNTNMSGF